MDLDIFLQEQNIKRYRKLIDSSTGDTERQMILKLLAEEMGKFKANQHQNNRRSVCSLKQI